jgi:hypothetical protein
VIVNDLVIPQVHSFFCGPLEELRVFCVLLKLYCKFEVLNNRIPRTNEKPIIYKLWEIDNLNVKYGICI